MQKEYHGLLANTIQTEDRLVVKSSTGVWSALQRSCLQAVDDPKCFNHGMTFYEDLFVEWCEGLIEISLVSISTQHIFI